MNQRALIRAGSVSDGMSVAYASGSERRSLVTALGRQGRVVSGSRFAVDAAEDHSAGVGLQHAGHGDAHLVANRAAALFYHNHRPVVEITYSLPDLVALLDDAHRQALAGQRR